MDTHISFVDINESFDFEYSHDELSNEKSQTIKLKVPQKWIIYPENSYKLKWDFWIVLILFFVAITLPARIAFV